MGVIIEDTAAGSTIAHGNDPFWLGHLVVEAAQDGRHLA